MGVALNVVGCASGSHVLGISPATRPSNEPIEATQQTGGINTAANVDTNVGTNVSADDWSAIRFETAVPVGQVALMMLIIYLSHRREMYRIRYRGGTPEAPPGDMRERPNV